MKRYTCRGHVDFTHSQHDASFTFLWLQQLVKTGGEAQTPIPGPLCGMSNSRSLGGFLFCQSQKTSEHGSAAGGLSTALDVEFKSLLPDISGFLESCWKKISFSFFDSSGL